MKRFLKLFIKTLLITLFLLGTILGVLFWRLHQAPINTDKLAPYLSKNIDGLFFDSSSFFWKKIYKSPKIYLKNVRYTVENIKLSAEDAEIAFSLWKILFGIYEIEKLKMINPKGEIYLESTSESTSEKTLSDKIEKFIQAFEEGGRFIQNLLISNGTFSVKNSKNKKIELENINLVYKNGSEFISRSAYTSGKTAYMHLDGRMDGNDFLIKIDTGYTFDLAFELKAEKLHLQTLAGLFDINSPLVTNLNFPLSVDLKATIAMRKPFHGTLRATLEPLIILQNQEHKTKTEIEIKGKLKNNVLEFDLSATANPFPIKILPYLWPENLASLPRNWVIDNIIGGRVDQADINLRGAIPLDTRMLDVSHLGGNIIIAGAAVDYITGMPRVQNATVVGIYNQKDFHIDVKEGNIKNLKITDGHIVLKNMDLKDQDGDVTLKIEGPVREVLELIDHKPLEYCKLMKLDPAKSSGMAAIDLNLKFPLEMTLQPKDIITNIKAKLKKFGLFTSFGTHKLAIENGSLTLNLDNTEMTVVGPIFLDGENIHLKWHEHFNTKKPYKTKYDLSGNIKAKSLKQFLPTLLENSFEGLLGLNLTYQDMEKDRGQMILSLDMKKAKIMVPQLEWQKPAGEGGYAHFSFGFKEGYLESIRKLTVKLPSLFVQGSLGFKKGDLNYFKFPTFNWNDNVLEIEGTRDHHKIWDFNIHSPHLNVSRLLKDFLENEDEEDSIEEFNLKAKIKELVLSSELTLKNINTQISRKNKAWDYVDFLGTYNQSDVVEITFKPEKMEKKFHFRATNISPFLKAFDLVKNVEGGEVLIKGVESLQKPNSPVIGTLKIAEINVIEAPLLARLLALASFDGISSFLGGQGLKFSEGYVDFEKNQGIIALNKAGMRSMSLGMTAKGTINTTKKEIDLEGVIVPAYVFNQLLSYIPIIGQILSGGDAEKGIFSISYGIKGSTKDPKISVNPLSVLAPGLLKNMFDGGKSTSTIQAQKETEETKNTKMVSMA